MRDLTNTCLIPGSFDPFTTGHKMIVEKARHLFQLVIIGIAQNPNKGAGMFDVETRMKAIKAWVDANEYYDVDVVTYDCATATYCYNENIDYIVRGCRNGSEFDDEFTNRCINHALSHHKVETVIIPTSPSFSYISSTVVRECIKYNLEKWKSYVPEQSVPILEEALRKQREWRSEMQKLMSSCNKT